MKNKEKAVRDIAVALLTAIQEAREAGMVVVWPSRPEGLSAIAVSETAKAVTTAQITTDDDVPDAVLSKATVAATKAAEKVVDNAKA